MENLSPEQLIVEKQKLDLLKQELEEKNRQMFAMSETVYKEKKKIELQLTEILQEKTGLEIQKKENEEKVKMLWEQSTAIHHEKVRIEKLKTQVEYRHKEIIDSVHYAKKIQQAILPSQELTSSFLPDSFVFFKPKNIVSGDFYWAHRINQDQILFAAVDCTGHGVPGAFMSIMGYHLLEQIIMEHKLEEPALILNELSKSVVRSLKQTKELGSVKDGMDIALCKIDYKNYELEYAGAHNPLYLIRNGVLIETKADRKSIGISLSKSDHFLNHKIKLEKGDCLYVFSDGYVDQKGGQDNIKFFYQPFRDLLLEIHQQSMDDQKLKLEKIISEWKGDKEQIDDMLVIGVRV
jgi:serine phosphatase RsbU (regulator of sigma subunit)